MANKFTKGILERQEREYKQHHTAAVEQEPPETQSIPTPPITEPSPPPPKESLPTQPVLTEMNVSLATDLDAYLIRDGGRKAKNKTFYLDGAVIQAVKRAAAAKHVPESKLVNDILKKILLP